jgi:hypothetical protein
MDLAALWQAWPMFGPWQLRAGQHRANNLVQIVDTHDAGSFVLRVYQHQRDIRRIRYEHALVAQLQAARLPFTVPHPVPTSSGETVVSVPTLVGSLFASLWPLCLVPFHAWVISNKFTVPGKRSVCWIKRWRRWTLILRLM